LKGSTIGHDPRGEATFGARDHTFGSGIKFRLALPCGWSMLRLGIIHAVHVFVGWYEVVV
jgi:hypothetical protein